MHSLELEWDATFGFFVFFMCPAFHFLQQIAYWTWKLIFSASRHNIVL